ncbi:MAG: hypothetical protein WBL85_05875 [Sedimentisphaerales bacterium]
MKDIKEIYKNPMFYYMLVPALAAFWPVIIWGVYLPGARANYNNDAEQYQKSQPLMEELIAADPERLNATKGKEASAGFDYATAVQKAAEFCSVSANNYKLSSGVILKSEGQKTQSANVSLKGVEIAKAARFLSSIQQHWSGLQCTKINFRKNKGQPDAWDVDLTFKYYY